MTFLNSGTVRGRHKKNIQNYIYRTNKQVLIAGPCKCLFFAPKTDKAIITCGGLCPGLNVVIRELFLSLRYNYDFMMCRICMELNMDIRDFTYDWIKLDPNYVKNRHNQGGTTLGSSRGGFDLNNIVDSIVAHQVNQASCLVSDDTHVGLLELFKEIRK